jgi:hypothetical protein
VLEAGSAAAFTCAGRVIIVKISIIKRDNFKEPNLIITSFIPFYGYTALIPIRIIQIKNQGKNQPQL